MFLLLSNIRQKTSAQKNQPGRYFFMILQIFRITHGSTSILPSVCESPVFVVVSECVPQSQGDVDPVEYHHRVFHDLERSNIYIKSHLRIRFLGRVLHWKIPIICLIEQKTSGGALSDSFKFCNKAICDLPCKHQSLCSGTKIKTSTLSLAHSYPRVH